MNLRFSVLLFSVFILPPDTRATTIVAVRTPASVLVGTDSKMTAADGSAVAGQCKIATANSVYWAAANLKKDEEHNFDLDEIAAAAMRGPGSVSARIASFESAVPPKLAEILNDTPDDVFKEFHENQPSIDIVFAGLEDGVPYIHRRYFEARIERKTDDTRKGIFVRTVRPKCSGDPGCLTAIGSRRTVEGERARNPAMFRSMGVAQSIRHLIDTEIAAFPDAVGPPIAVLEIDKGGSRWISRGVCRW
jgi:hypothetical protein